MLRVFSLYHHKSTWRENETVFPKKLWNHYKNFGSRTTNHLEGYHNALNVLARKTRLNIFEMIKRLRKQEACFKITMNQDGSSGWDRPLDTDA